MPLQFATVEEPSFGRGIDARSAENQIRDGFVRDLVNSDIIEGRATKRKGYTTYAGNLPVRVVKYRQSNTLDKVYLTLDGSIDLSRTDVTPILVYGNTGVANSALSAVRYFPSWATNLKKALLTGTHTVDAPFTEHGIPSTSIYVGLGLLTSNDLTNETIFPDIGINGTTYDISATYTNNTGNAEEVVLFYVDGQNILGEKYSGIHTGTSFTINATGVGGHNLASTSILYQVYKDVGSGNLERVYPDTVILSPTTGDISFTFSESATYTVLLSTAPATQSFSSLAPVSSNGSFQVTLPNITSPYLLYSVYAAATGEEIYPDTVTYNDIAKTATFAFSTFNQSVSIYYIHGTVRTNEIAIDTPVTVDRETTSPQLTIYGLSHGEIYGDGKEVNRRGWATHLDSYKSPRTTHMVAGLGGNLFAALQPGDEYFPSSLTNAFPEYYPNLNSRTVASDQIIGPAFWSPNETPNKTRGSIHFDGGATHWATVTSVTYQSGGLTRYILSTPSLSYSGSPIQATPTSTVNGAVSSSSTVTLTDATFFSSVGTLLINGERYNYTSKVGNVLSEVTPLLTAANNAAVEETIGDYLTVKGMSSSRHSGVFQIRSVSYGANSITLDVVNPRLTNNDYDDAGTSGLAAIFTDQVNLTSNPFLAGDELLSSAWGDTAQLLVDSVSGNTLVLSQVFDKVSLTASLVVTGRRTSNELPLRNLSTSTSITPSLFYIVAGDTLSIGDVNRPVQVTAVDADTATLTLDEALTWEDNISLPTPVNVSKRWIPAESPTPDSADVLLPQTTTRYLTANPYDNQPFLRSAMVQNNMYLTNGDDEVYKYDGRNFYRAGIIPWQPGLFLTAESVVSGGVPLVGFNPVAVLTPLSGDKLEVSKTDSTKFRVGDTYLFTNTSGFKQYLTLEENIEKDASAHYLKFKEPLQFTSLGTTPTLSLVYVARYYFRLNIRDTNGVITASAVTGAEDFVTLINPTSALQYKINLRLVGLPAWDQYDFSNKNIEVEVYRTLWTTTAVGETPVFFRLPQTKVCSFAGTDGYIDIIDTYGNDTLQSPDLVVGVLSPDTVPAAWDEPPRAKYVTTAGNRLVLANLTDWPTLSLSYLAKAAIDETAFNLQRILFKKDITAAGTATDMVNRVGYELRSSGQVLASLVSSSAGNSFVFAAAVPRAIQTKDWVYIDFKTTSVDGLTYNGWWQITESAAAAATTTTGAQNNVTTLNVVSTTGFLSAGSFIRNSVTYTYTGITATTITGIVPNITVSSGDTITSTAASFRVSTPLATASIPSGITYPISAVFASTALDVPVWLGSDYNMGMFNGQVVGFTAPEIRVIRRLGMAINATMRMTNTALAGQEDFMPWIVARSESDTTGQLIVKQPRVESTLLGLLITNAAASTNLTTYVNGSLISGVSAPISAAVTRYPSRIAASYNNFPEIFDNLWTINEDASSSVIDINSADGQEITGIIPFFGDSAFGASQQAGVLVVFKQNSIYLVNLAAKAEGINPVQRLETQGLGCTAPYSIAPTKDGIAFANDSGIYVLRRNQRIEYLGRYVERLWQKSVDKNWLSLVQGHHYSVGRQYKLSVPLSIDSTADYAANSEVYVYNHTGESDGEAGGWARYTNHPATGWANLFQDAFFSTTEGAVKSIRNTGEASDYRDDANAIESVLEARATAFGNTAVRKAVATVTVHYRSGANSDNTSVYMTPDLYQEYDLSSSFRVLTKPGVVDGLGSIAGQDVVSIAHSFPKRRCIYMAVKIINSGIDENVEIAGFSYTVAGLSGAGVKQAGETE